MAHEAEARGEVSSRGAHLVWRILEEEIGDIVKDGGQGGSLALYNIESFLCGHQLC